MRLRLLGLILLITTTITGCTHGTAGDRTANSMQNSGSGFQPKGILGSLRPKADPSVVERMHEEEELAKQKAALEAQRLQTQQQQQVDTNGLGRVLPRVSTDPIAPPAEQIANDGPIFSGADSGPPVSSSNSGPPEKPVAPTPVTYGRDYSSSVPAPPPGVVSGGLVPPPPAVTLSTQANMGAPVYDPNANPYANPYLNPYGIPMPQQAFMQPPQAQQYMQQGQRPMGSPFGSGVRNASSDGGDEDAAKELSDHQKKLASFVPIIPAGMDSRSAYKQRDDLKVLWKGALTATGLAQLMKDDKFSEQLAHVDIGLPNESSKGAFNVSSRTVDTIYHSPALDKRISGYVRKFETDVAQGYYRYLYTYNRYALAQQTVAARKQEVDVAGSAAEQQRAAADLSQAQNEADSAKEDMRSAQNELASVAGATAARTIIGRVSGVTPTVDSLAQAPQGGDAGAIAGSVFNNVGSFLGFGKGKTKDAAAGNDQGVKVAKADGKGEAKKEKEKSGKKNKERKETKQAAGDLAPAPQAASERSEAAEEAATPAPVVKTGQEISFELKNVDIKPRKSVLNVSIRNSGDDSFSFNPDVFTASEGNHKLPEAAMRADFESTLVQPNQEVKGTITIFGRPWNDKIAVVLNNGRKPIQLRRQ